MSKSLRRVGLQNAHNVWMSGKYGSAMDQSSSSASSCLNV